MLPILKEIQSTKIQVSNYTAFANFRWHDPRDENEESEYFYRPVNMLLTWEGFFSIRFDTGVSHICNVNQNLTDTIFNQLLKSLGSCKSIEEFQKFEKREIYGVRLKLAEGKLDFADKEAKPFNIRDEDLGVWDYVVKGLIEQYSLQEGQQKALQIISTLESEFNLQLKTLVRQQYEVLKGKPIYKEIEDKLLKKEVNSVAHGSLEYKNAFIELTNIKPDRHADFIAQTFKALKNLEYLPNCSKTDFNKIFEESKSIPLDWHGTKSSLSYFSKSYGNLLGVKNHYSLFSDLFTLNGNKVTNQELRNASQRGNRNVPPSNLVELIERLTRHTT